MLTHTENVDLRYWKMLTNFTEMVDTFPEKVDSCRSLFSRCARSINLVDLFLWDCPGTGLGESDKSFLRYR